MKIKRNTQAAKKPMVARIRAPRAFPHPHWGSSSSGRVMIEISRRFWRTFIENKNKIIRG